VIDQKSAGRIGFHAALAIATLLSLSILVWIAVDSWIMPRVARSGWEVVTVPDITGLDAQAASAKLAEAGLDPVIDPQRKSSGHMGPDLVLLQSPLAKDSVKKGHVVRFWLSAGSTTVPVPDLAGQDSTEAETHVQESGLEIGFREWAASAKTPVGSVIKSDPPAGTLIVRGTAIKIVISSGPDPDSTTGEESGKSGNPPRVF
jgi:eukaryotic-like serine/threonine-protein kinase